MGVIWRKNVCRGVHFSVAYGDTQLYLGTVIMQNSSGIVGRGLATPGKNSRLKFNLEKPKDPEVADLFETTIGVKFAVLNFLKENIDNLAENIHGALDNTASEVLGQARKKNLWMTNDVLDLCDRRMRLKKRRKGGQLAMQNRTTLQSSQSSNQKKNETGKGKLDCRPMSRN